jgi:type I restriction enzyme R subunit
MHLRYVDEFSERSRWDAIDSSDVHNIEEHLAALPVPDSINEVGRRFDLMMLKL